MLKAGILRERIHIQRRTTAEDDWGSPNSAWENITAQRLAANVRHRSGMSTIKADADVSVSRVSMRIRRRTDVNAGMRVLFDGQVYEIDDVLPGESREYIDLVCRRTQGVQKK